MDAPVARSTVIFVEGISCFIKSSLLSSSDWCCIKVFDVPRSTWALSVMYFATSSVKEMRETSLPDAVAHDDSGLGATLVKRPANQLTLLNQLGAPHLLNATAFLMSATMLGFRNSVDPTPWDLLGGLTGIFSCGTWYQIQGNAFVCIVHCTFVTGHRWPVLTQYKLAYTDTL